MSYSLSKIQSNADVMLSELYGSIRGFCKISRSHYQSNQNIEAVPREIAIAPFPLVKVDVFFFFFMFFSFLSLFFWISRGLPSRWCRVKTFAAYP